MSGIVGVWWETTSGGCAVVCGVWQEDYCHSILYYRSDLLHGSFWIQKMLQKVRHIIWHSWVAALLCLLADMTVLQETLLLVAGAVNVNLQACAGNNGNSL